MYPHLGGRRAPKPYEAPPRTSVPISHPMPAAYAQRYHKHRHDEEYYTSLEGRQRYNHHRAGAGRRGSYDHRDESTVTRCCSCSLTSIRAVALWLLFAMLAVGGAAAAGAILLLVGKPLLVYFRGNGGESSTSGGASSVDHPAQVAGTGAIGGVLALFLPCIVFLVDAWYLHPMLRLAVPRARWVDVVLYIVAQIAFAVGVGVWSAVVPLGGKGSSEMEENSAVTTAREVVDGVEAAVLGSTMLHAGRALLFSGLWAVRYVPRGVEEVGVRSDD